MTEPLDLTGGSLLARNAFLNLIGQGAPFLIGIMAIPVIIHSAGVERYGVFSLSLMLVGYLGLFDFGLGTATTKLIAEAAGAGDRNDIAIYFWTSLSLLSGFGLIIAIVTAWASPWLVSHLLDIPAPLQMESLNGLYVTAFSLPFVVSSASLSGALAALQRFDLINFVRVPVGVFFYVGPLFVLPFSHSVTLLIAVLIAGRLVAWMASFVLCLRVIPELRNRTGLRPKAASTMLRYGGWVNASALITAFADYADRLLIGAVLPIADVSYYAVPRQMASKLLILPGAVSNVVFSAFSATIKSDPSRAALLLERSTRYIFLTLLPLVLFAITLAPEILTLWLGSDFSQQSTNVFRWVLLGVLVHGVAWPAGVLVPAAHRPDLFTKLHLIEVPAYLGFLWMMVSKFGIEGAAIAWACTVFVDTIITFAIVRRLFPLATSAIRRTAILASAAAPLLVIGWILPNLTTKSAFLAIFTTSFVLFTWLSLLAPDEKEFIHRHVRSRRLI